MQTKVILGWALGELIYDFCPNWARFFLTMKYIYWQSFHGGPAT